MDHAKSMLPYLKSLDDKYNVLYVNTPWNSVDMSTLERFPAASLTPPDAALFLWVDSYTVAKASKLLEKWGFSFHSVYQVLDIAKYPWMKKDAKAKEVISKQDGPKEETTEQGGGSADDGNAGEAPAADSTKDGEKKEKKKGATRKSRAPPVSPPKWWTSKDDTVLTPSRPTTEQLWLATKGDPSRLFTSVSLAYNVVNYPELGAKSRAKKIAGNDKWDTERPGGLMENVTRHLTQDANFLNVFASSMNASVDCWGPGVPGGYLSSSKKSAGVVGVVNKALRGLKKTQLQLLTSKIPKIIQADGVSLDDIKTTWDPVMACITDMAVKAPYDVRNVDGSVNEWVLELVLCLAKECVSEFTALHAKKKKRRPTLNADANRPRYGIASKSVVSEKLAAFLGLEKGDTIARTKVVSAINSYIVDKGLKDAQDKSKIILDDKLRELLAPPENFGSVTFFNWCNLLSPHFPKSKKVLKAEKQALDEADGGKKRAVEAVVDAKGKKVKVCK